jgi:transposase
MKTEQHKYNFISLRAKGNSFDSIAKEIEVSKPILIEWNKIYREEIENIKTEAFEEFLQENKLTLKHRLEILSIIQKRLSEELQERNLDSISTSRIIDLLLKINTMTEEAVPEVNYFTEQDIKEKQFINGFNLF